MEECLRLRILPIVFANVLLQSVCGELPLFFSQPRSRAREVRQDEECTKRDYDGNCTFDDEDPSPGSEPMRPVHVTGDASCD